MDHDTEETNTESSQTQPPSYTQVSDPNQELSPSFAFAWPLRHLSQSWKRPHSSLAKLDNPEPKQQRASSVTASRDPYFKFLYTAAKQAGTKRKKLMTTIPGPQYYRCRALYLQHRYGNMADLELQSRGHRNLKDKELNAWVELHRMIA